MTGEIKTVTGSVSSISNNDVLEIISPPSGQIWLVDSIQFDTYNGRPNNDMSLYFVVANRNNSISLTGYPAAAEIGGYEPPYGYTQFNTYVDDSTKGVLYSGRIPDFADPYSCSMEYMIMIRRIK